MDWTGGLTQKLILTTTLHVQITYYTSEGLHIQHVMAFFSHVSYSVDNLTSVKVLGLQMMFAVG